MFIEPVGKLLDRRKGNDRGAAKHYAARHWLTALFPFKPMEVAAGMMFDRWIKADTVRCLNLGAVVAVIVAAVYWALGNEMGRRHVRRVVPARRRDRDGDRIQAVSV